MKSIAWEQRLKAVFDEIDPVLEDKFGALVPLHPVRQKKGTTSNPEMDGLFNVGASYSAGFGSAFGPGYVVEIRLSTLEEIPLQLEDEIRDLVQDLLIKKLPAAFPGKKLIVDKEKYHLRIHGDLSFN